MFCSCFVVTVVLCISIFVCTSVGLLPPGESPIAVNNNNNNNNNKYGTGCLFYYIIIVVSMCHVYFFVIKAECSGNIKSCGTKRFGVTPNQTHEIRVLKETRY
jgi:uncharacterized membrane protein YccF (DUF307 family)